MPLFVGSCLTGFNMKTPLDIYKEEEPLRLHSSRVIPLWVDGKPPYEVSVTESILAFGGVLLGGNTSKSIHVINTGFEPLGITGITINVEAFTLDPVLPTLVRANKSIEIPVKFTPKVFGATLGNVTITFDKVPETKVSLTGSGVWDYIGLVDKMLADLWGFLQRATLPALTTNGPFLSLSLTSVAYVDPVDVGQTSPTTTITISNPGNQNLVLSNLAVSGEFEIVP